MTEQLSEKEKAARRRADGKARVKRLQEEAKAKRRAEKERKRNSTDPKDMGRLKQIREVYRLTKEHDPNLPWLLLVAFLVPVVVLVTIGFLVGRPIMVGLLGLPVGLLLTTIVLTRRAKKATFLRYQGQAGSAEVALNMLPKGWTSTPALTFNKHKDMVHRAVGRSGIVLIGEGDSNRVRAMLNSEQRKHEKFTDAPVTTIIMGERKNEVPLGQLTSHIQKMPKVLQKYELTEVISRLRAIDATRPRMPMPKGPMPSMKGSRREMRGR